MRHEVKLHVFEGRQYTNPQHLNSRSESFLIFCHGMPDPTFFVRQPPFNAVLYLYSFTFCATSLEIRFSQSQRNVLQHHLAGKRWLSILLTFPWSGVILPFACFCTPSSCHLYVNYADFTAEKGAFIKNNGVTDMAVQSPWH